MLTVYCVCTSGLELVLEVGVFVCVCVHLVLLPLRAQCDSLCQFRFVHYILLQSAHHISRFRICNAYVVHNNEVQWKCGLQHVALYIYAHDTRANSSPVRHRA